MPGWQLKSIGEVCEVLNGGTPKTATNTYWGGEHLWITPAEMGKRSNPYVDATDRTLTDAGLGDSSARMLPPFSVILSSRAPIGHLVINTKAMATNQGCKGLVPGKSVHYKFLYYYLRSIVDLLNDLGTGTTFKEISAGKLKDVSIPVPPLAEQRRIVTILDTVFEGIDKVITKTEKNCSQSRDVFQNYLQAIFTRRGKDWEERALGDVCEFENGDRGKNYPNRDEYVEAGVPWINTGHIQPDGSLSQIGMNFISVLKYKSLRSGKIRPGDLVYCLRGATLGKTALVAPFTMGAVASSLVIIRPKKSIDSLFLYYFLTSPTGQRLIKLYDNGTAQPNLGAKNVAKYRIPLPKMDDQKFIAKKIQSLAYETAKLESKYQRKRTLLNDFRHALLHKVFSGNFSLVDKDVAA